MKRSLLGLLIVAALVLGGVSPTYAGWVLVEEDGQETVISKGKMRADWEQGAFILDGHSAKVHFIDDNRKMIASGSVEDFCTGMKQLLDNLLEGVPEEQREMMKKMMGGEPPKVEIVEKGSGGKVGGFETVHYAIMADGELYEELWVTKDKALMVDCDPVMKMMGQFMSCVSTMTAMSAGSTPEASPEYAKIFGLGMIVKSLEKDEAEPTETLISKKEVPDSAFAVPEGYKAVAFSEMFGMDGQ